MRRDSIFYQLFQQYPQLLFDLLPTAPANAAGYRFDSVAVKEPRFEIDGVFLPPDDAPGVLYFAEVQFQKDPMFYERVFAEVFLYFYRNRERFSNWQIVIIYPSRKMEQSETLPYRCLLASEQVHRIYLDELGNIRQLPVQLSLMVLTTLGRDQAAAEARYLLSRTAEETSFASQTLVGIVTTIMMYRYTEKSIREIDQMLGISIDESRAYREIKEEGKQEGIQEGERLIVLRQLARRMGELPQAERDRIESLPLETLESLSEALLDFEGLADLQTWLEALPTESE